MNIIKEITTIPQAIEDLTSLLAEGSWQFVGNTGDALVAKKGNEEKHFPIKIQLKDDLSTSFQSEDGKPQMANSRFPGYFGYIVTFGQMEYFVCDKGQRRSFLNALKNF